MRSSHLSTSYLHYVFIFSLLSGTGQSQPADVYRWVWHSGATQRRRSLWLCSQNSLWLASIVLKHLYTVLSDWLWASACALSLTSRTAKKRVEQKRGTEVKWMRRKGAVSIVSLSRHSPAFPSVSLSSFLFLWDSEQISNNTATAPNRGSHGREIWWISLRYHLAEWCNSFELWHLAACWITLITLVQTQWACVKVRVYCMIITPCWCAWECRVCLFFHIFTNYIKVVSLYVNAHTPDCISIYSTRDEHVTRIIFIL